MIPNGGELSDDKLAGATSENDSLPSAHRPAGALRGARPLCGGESPHERSGNLPGGDGHLDIFCAEMNTPGPKEKCTAWILYGDGQGNFKVQELSVGIGNHDSRVADVSGDGRLDIVTKPYTWDAPRLDLWLNQGGKP